MSQKIRFGDYVHEVSVHQYEISYNDLAPNVETDASGEHLPVKQTKLALKPIDMYHLLSASFHQKENNPQSQRIECCFRLYHFPSYKDVSLLP